MDSAEKVTAFLAKCQTLDPGPIPYGDLPLAGDEDLERQFDAAYGGDPSGYQFALLSCPLETVVAALDADVREIAQTIARLGSDFYRHLEGDWLDAWDEEIQNEPDASYSEIDSDYPDGERRADIVDHNLDTLAGGGELLPLVVDIQAFDHPSMGVLCVRDGMHRLAAHIIAGSKTVQFWNLLPEED